MHRGVAQLPLGQRSYDGAVGKARGGAMQKPREHDMNAQQPDLRKRVQLALDAGDSAAAITACEARLRDTPDDVSAYRYLGQIRAALGERGSALHAAKRAVDLAPDDARAWSDVGRVHAMFGEGAEAIAAFQRAVGINERDADGWHDLGTALKRIGIRCAPTTLLALSPPSIPRLPTPRRSLRSTVIMAPTSSSTPRSKPTSGACRRENSLQMSNFYVQQYHG